MILFQSGVFQQFIGVILIMIRITVLCAIVVSAFFGTQGFSAVSSGAPRKDIDMFIREKADGTCQWFNSGIMGLIPRRFNETTICRCRIIGVYECTTVVVHKSSTAAPPLPTAAAFDSNVSSNRTTVATSVTSSNTESNQPIPTSSSQMASSMMTDASANEIEMRSLTSVRPGKQ